MKLLIEILTALFGAIATVLIESAKTPKKVYYYAKNSNRLNRALDIAKRMRAKDGEKPGRFNDGAGGVGDSGD